jgi:N-acetylglucosamine-6-phosphate deacetylase
MAERRISGRDPATGETITLRIDGGVIRAIEAGGKDSEIWLAPGFVDLQVNGYRGHDVNAEEMGPDTIAALAGALAAGGVTRFLPTIITASEPRILAALRAIARARQDDPAIAHAIPGIHVEGPHVSPLDGARGAHPVAHVRPPDFAEFARWQEACGGLVRIVTLSPHWPGAPDYIAALTATGVHVAIGHTHDEPDAIRAAVAAGARLSTHLGNGIAATLPRHPNAIWTQLAEDRLTKTFIADGHHLPADTLKAMIRAAGLSRSILVSDVTALGGMKPGIYDQPVGGAVELHADGRLSLRGTPFLAGAARPLRAGLEMLLDEIGLDLPDAIRLVCANPADFVGGGGRLEPGAPADIVGFHWAPGTRGVQVEFVLAHGVDMLDA